MKQSTVLFGGLILLLQNVACNVIADAGGDTWEDVHMICPNQCVCQRSHYMDLSISRWIQAQKGDRTHSSALKTARNRDSDDEDQLALENDNETFLENDSSHLENAFVKFVMCWLQASGNMKNLADQLPMDVQALVLLHNGNRNSNYTIAASDLLPFRHLETLEIRGSSGGQPNLNFLMDEPLAMIKHVNFESIQLLGDEQMKKRMPLSQHPSETYDYVPESERIFYNVSLEMKEEEEVQIVSYDVYRMEQLKSKQPTFYGWANLHVLRIHQCQFDQVHWEMFDGLEKLQHLSLEHNDIKIVPPFAFYGALNIRSLSLAHNSILDMNYRALAGLLELETLDLSNNNLTKLSEMSFPPFPHLAKVDLRHNPIRYIFPMTFGVMNTTKQMTIGSDAMALDLTIGSSFGALEMLEFLTLRNVSIPTLSEWVFRGLHGIRTLRMSGHVRRIEFDAFAEMSALRELVLSHCGIVEISMDAFYGVRHLEVVDLSHNQLVAIPHGLFDEQRQLKEIYLQRNRLTMLPARFFDLPSIKLVRLIENPWMCSCEMRTWRQAITNRVRGKRLPAQRVCSDNAKTGFETCVEAESPRYSYEFDNKMSPRCDGGPEDFRYRSVYYTMRHSIKCLEVAVARHATKVERSGARFASDPETSHRMDKMRIKKKYEMTVDAIRSQAVAKSGVVMRMHRRPQRINPKSQQKLAIQNKLREMYQRDKLRQQEISNNIDL